MFLYAVRFLFTVLVLAVTWTYIGRSDIKEGNLALWLVSGGITFSVVMMLVEWLIPRKGLRVLGAVLFGLIGGMLVGYAVGLVIELIASTMTPQEWNREPSRTIFVSTIKMLVGLISCYFCVSFVLKTKDDFRFIIPYVEFSKQAKGARPILLDTSTIIDGRIADLCNTGLIDAPLIVPRFVLNELQAVADHSDRLKRNRGRRGLDMLNQLQRSERVDVDIIEPRWGRREPGEGVDQKLVTMAIELDARIMTIDSPLAKVAQLRGVDVVNLHEVSKSLKPVVLPGEVVTVKLVRPGDEANQGVGYLEDGTMVVVEGGRERIGQETAIVVTSALQTSAGRMLFGHLNVSGMAPTIPAPRAGRQRRPEPARNGPHPGRSDGNAPPTGPERGARDQPRTEDE